MPDISMCYNDKCPDRTACYRFMAEPDPRWQSYEPFSPKPRARRCDAFMPIYRLPIYRSDKTRKSPAGDSRPDIEGASCPVSKVLGSRRKRHATAATTATCDGVAPRSTLSGRAIRKHNDAMFSWFPWLTAKDKAALLKKRGGVIGGVCGDPDCPACGETKVVIRKAKT